MKLCPPALRRNQGFTLAELLVAMVIFLTLMSGVMVMFGASITAVNETYARKDTYEAGRAALGVIARDLQSAFTAREHGDLYNFYGTPYGFTFIGALQNGKLGRITYALRFSGQFAELDAMRIGDAAALLAGAPIDPADVTDRTDFHPIYWLIRYEESGDANLENFDLPGGLQWPTIDSVFPLRDQDITPPPENNSPHLYNLLRLAVRNPDGTDLRDMIFSLRYSNTGGLHIVDSNFVAQVLAAKKRQLWIDMVAGRGAFANALLTPGQIPPGDYFARILAEQGYELADYAVAEEILATPLTDANGDNLYDGLYPDGRLIVATLSFFTYAGPDGTRAATFNALDNLSFPNLNDKDLDNRNLIRWGTFKDPNNPKLFNHLMLQSFDDGLARLLAGKRGYTTALGLPILPRIPALVEPNFVVFYAPKRVGGASFQKQFSQAIEVPAGLTRGLPPNIAPSPS